MFVYGLSDAGVRHAFRHGYATEATKTFEERSVMMLDHELEITAFHMALDRWCRSADLRYVWRQRNLKHGVHPDACFTVESAAGTGRRFTYFLEIERAKLGNYRNGTPQILRKLARYYEYFNSMDCERKWGFRHFRVMVVQRTEARSEGLLGALQAGYRHRMFWLTSEDRYRKDIGGEIFKTPKDYAERSYSLLHGLVSGE